MEDKNMILSLNRNEFQIIANGLILLIKDNTGLAEFKEVFPLLNKINEKLDIYTEQDMQEEEGMYVSVKYEDEHWPKTFKGGEYSYYTKLELEVGDIVEAPTRYGSSFAKVTKVNIPEEQIEDIKPAIKEITRKLDKVRFIYYNEIKEVA